MAAESEFWIEAPEVVRLFPTFVWKCRLRPEVHRTINAAILDRLHEMRRGLPPLAAKRGSRVMGCTNRKSFAAWCLASRRPWIPRLPSCASVTRRS